MLISLDAVETDEKGNAKLDQAGKPIFRDYIGWTGDNAQIMGIWNAIKALLETNIATKGNVIMPEDVEATHYLMEMTSKLYRPNHTGTFQCELPVNYTVALCHVLGASAALSIDAEKDKKFQQAILKLRDFFAVEVEGYRRKKKEETAMDTTPDEVLEKSLTVRGKGYF